VRGNKKMLVAAANVLYNVIVVGGGHAGCEAALAASRMGQSVLMVTLKKDKIAEMPCNPSVGGVGKGQLVKELDALGGEMGKNADYTGIQFRRLNTKKGSAVRSSRCQSDKQKYAARMQEVIAGQERLDVLEAEVKELLVEDKEIRGVLLKKDAQTQEILAKAVVITAGTFMQAVMHCGEKLEKGGRIGEGSSQGLSGSLQRLGHKLLRLKTGTPPRLLGESLNFDALKEQPGDNPPRPFSFSQTEIVLPQVHCYLTFTNPNTHAVIEKNLSRSPLYSGKIQGIGPRYRPSIEDKVVKFPDKPRHQIFLEPEGLDTDWIYPNGVSTSLPADVQEAFIHSIAGCEEAKFVRYGYAVEYDCVDPRQLTHSLETKHVSGLFLAGQLNGTSGYEEAASQGQMAGINAALRCQNEDPFTLLRSQSYIGVMIDDLVTLGVTEPYRMFTSRAEFRLSLREDNADLRLRDYGYRLGLVSDEDFLRFNERKKAFESTIVYLKKTFAKPKDDIQQFLIKKGTSTLSGTESLLNLLKRPELDLKDVLSFSENDFESHLDVETRETIEVEVKYEGYIAIQRAEIERLNKMRSLSIPVGFDFEQIAGLSYEVREILTKRKPQSLAEASQIPGITPAALTTLLFSLKTRGNRPANAT